MRKLLNDTYYLCFLYKLLFYCAVNLKENDDNRMEEGFFLKAFYFSVNVFPFLVAVSFV